MIPAALERTRPVVNALHEQLLTQGLHYFFPSSQLQVTARTEESSARFLLEDTGRRELNFDWLGKRYRFSDHREFSDHQQRMLLSIGTFLATRYELLFDRDLALQNVPQFGGLSEDRYISAFLEPHVFRDVQSMVRLPDRVSEAIEVLRISALSSYEDKRISTGALLFGSIPDSCHPVPSRPVDALLYSSELTSIRSFHRICDGLRTIALVDARGAMVELVDIQEWAQPYSDMELQVPTARRYRTHSQSTLCGGHICLVLTPNGEIKIFGEGVQLFSFLDGRWHLTDALEKYQAWETAVGDKHFASRLFSAALNLAEYRRGGMFVVLDDPRYARQLVSSQDMLDSKQLDRTSAKNQLHYLLRQTRANELSVSVLESIAQIDGSVVLDRDSRLLAFGAILRHSLPADRDEDIGEGGRTAAAINASHFGNILMVSEGGQLSFYRNGHCMWTL